MCYPFFRSYFLFHLQIVEELEDRLAERMEEVISQVQASLVLNPALVSPPAIAAPQEIRGNGGGDDWKISEAYAGDEFDDRGEGAGVEGDLDMDDD